MGLVAGDGKIIAKRRFETDPSIGPYLHLERCIHHLNACIQECSVDMQTIAGIGVSVPGPADTRNGILLRAHYAGWTDVKVSEYISRFYSNKMVAVANDANACALGELVLGEGKKYSNFIWVTISTGIGTGLVINRKIFEGEHGVAGELGHTIVEWEHGQRCTCGNMGCLEAQASGNAIAKMAEVECLKSCNSMLSRYLTDNSLEVTAEVVAKAARDGVKQALEIFDTAGRYIGRAFSYAVNLFNPGCIFIGGGVGLSFDLLEPGIMEAMEKAVMGGEFGKTAVKPTILGYEASLIGAASLVFI